MSIGNRPAASSARHCSASAGSSVYRNLPPTTASADWSKRGGDQLPMLSCFPSGCLTREAAQAEFREILEDEPNWKTCCAWYRLSLTSETCRPTNRSWKDLAPIEAQLSAIRYATSTSHFEGSDSTEGSVRYRSTRPRHAEPLSVSQPSHTMPCVSAHSCSAALLAMRSSYGPTCRSVTYRPPGRTSARKRPRPTHLLQQAPPARSQARPPCR